MVNLEVFLDLSSKSTSNKINVPLCVAIQEMRTFRRGSAAQELQIRAAHLPLVEVFRQLFHISLALTVGATRKDGKVRCGMEWDQHTKFQKVPDLLLLPDLNLKWAQLVSSAMNLAIETMPPAQDQ